MYVQNGEGRHIVVARSGEDDLGVHLFRCAAGCGAITHSHSQRWQQFLAGKV